MGLKTPLTKAGMKTSIADAPEQFTLFDTAIVPLTKTEVTDRIDLGKFDGCHIEIDFTLGSLTDVLVIPEFADTNDNADYHQATLRDADTNGVITIRPISFKITASGKYHIALKKQGRFMRLFLNGDADATGSTIKVVIAGAHNIDEMADVSTDTVTVTPSGVQTTLVEGDKVFIGGASRTLKRHPFDVDATAALNEIAGVASKFIHIVGIEYTVDTDLTTFLLRENGGSNLHEAMTSNRGGGKVNNPPGRVLWVTPNVAKGLDIVTVVGKATGTIWYAQF